jgi:hypothetical protein
MEENRLDKESILQGKLQDLRDFKNYSEKPQDKIFEPGDPSYGATKYRKSFFTGIAGDLDLFIRWNLVTDPEVIEKAQKFISWYKTEFASSARVTPEDINKANEILDFILSKQL